MNEKEINEAFDREYEQYKNSPEHKYEFVKIKMPTYYIAKHSDEDLQAAVLAERESCAEHYLGIMRDAVAQAVNREREACAKLCESEGHRIDASWESCAAAIRGRTE
jgi:hypothetical protein